MARPWMFCVALIVGACSPERAPSAPSSVAEQSGGMATRVLMLTATAGFRHDSIATARQVLTTIGASSREFTVTPTEDLSTMTAATLANYDVLFFALTSGELAFTSDQKAAILAFVDGGKGFMGVHSATDTLYGWPEYGTLIGTYLRDHPWTQPAAVVVEDRTHPSTAELGDRFTINEEFYAFRDNPRSHAQVLLRLDAASVGATGDYPLAWASSFGRGRTYYNALGHFPETWNDVRYQRQLVGAIRWLARK